MFKPLIAQVLGFMLFSSSAMACASVNLTSAGGGNSSDIVFESENIAIYKLGVRSFGVKTKSGKSELMGANSGVIVTDRGLILIDAHTSAVAEKEVMSALDSVFHKPVYAVILTHAHADHVGGLPVHSGAKIIDWKNAKSLKDVAELEIILVGHSHSENELVVWDQKDKVVFTGDFFVNGYIGYLGEADFKNWVGQIDQVAAKVGAATFFSGHGYPATLVEFRGFGTYLRDFVKSAIEHFQRVGSPEGYELPEKYRDLGAQFYLQENIEHAFELWKKGEL